MYPLSQIHFLEAVSEFTSLTTTKLEEMNHQILKLQTEVRELEAKKADDKKAIANLKRLLDQETDWANEYCLEGAEGLKAAKILYEALSYQPIRAMPSRGK